jgi:hypothetical protein
MFALLTEEQVAEQAGDLAGQRPLGHAALGLLVKDELVFLKIRRDSRKSVSAIVNSFLGAAVLVTFYGRRCPN